LQQSHTKVTIRFFSTPPVETGSPGWDAAQTYSAISHGGGKDFANKL
jgi:hypothetical protein